MTARSRLLGAVFAAGLAMGAAAMARAGAQSAPADQPCGSASVPQVRTTLYFGTTRPKGTVSELEWQLFLTRYRRAFDQQSVLWETARVCAAS